MMKSIGFDHIIDYRKEDFTKNGQRYDLILDTKTNRWPFAYLSSLMPRGKYITVGGYLVYLLQLFLLGPILSRFSKKDMRIVALRPNKDLDYINQLYQEGKIKCMIDGPFSLSEAANAVQYFGQGKHQGKVILSV